MRLQVRRSKPEGAAPTGNWTVDALLQVLQIQDRQDFLITNARQGLFLEPVEEVAQKTTHARNPGSGQQRSALRALVANGGVVGTQTTVVAGVAEEGIAAHQVIEAGKLAVRACLVREIVFSQLIFPLLDLSFQVTEGRPLAFGHGFHFIDPLELFRQITRKGGPPFRGKTHCHLMGGLGPSSICDTCM